MFQENIPNLVTLHWNGKLLPFFNVGDRREERHPVFITHEENEQLIGVLKLLSSSDREKTRAIINAIKYCVNHKYIGILYEMLEQSQLKSHRKF